MNYEYNRRELIDLAPVLDLVHKRSKTEDFIEQLQKIHTATQESLKKDIEYYKIDANKRCRASEFQVGDLFGLH